MLHEVIISYLFMRNIEYDITVFECVIEIN